MKRALGKMKRTISVLLAAAMIITALPQTSALAYASEVQDVLSEGDEAAEIVGEDKENNDTGNNSADAEEKENSDETGSGETEVTDQTNPEGTDVPEEDPDQTAADETLAGDDTDASLTDDMEELDETTIRVFETGENDDDNPQAETINVNITLPYYRDEKYNWTPFLAELSYAIDDETNFKLVDLKSDKVNYFGKCTVSVPVEVGKDFNFKLSCKDNTRLKDVTLQSKYSSGNSSPEILTAEDGVYTITVNKQDNYGWSDVKSYEIEITAIQIWTITFVDLYARNHENTASVEIYQAKQEGQIEEPADIAGQTVTVDSEEWDKCYYKVKVKDKFTFDSMVASVSGITIKESWFNDETAYQLEKKAGVPKDITIFVTAEETQDKTLTLNMPSEVTNAMEVAVYGKTPSDTRYNELELNKGTVTVRDDMAVCVTVTSNIMDYMVQATYQETGEEPETFAESDVYTRVEDGSWTREYTLGTLNHVEDGITINLSRAKVNRVRMAVNWGAVSEISVNAPVSGSYYPGDEVSGDGVTTYVPEGETLKFYVVMENGKGAACVSTEDGKEIGIDHESTYWGTVTSYYNIVPTSDMTISVKGREYEYRFDYSEEDVSILVYETEERDNGPTGDPLELTDHCYRTYNKSSYLWVMIKPKTNKELSVWYNKGDDRADVEREEWYDKTEEDGGKYLCYGPIDEYWAMDNTITIEGYNTNTVTFETENNLSFYKMTYDMDWGFNQEDRIDGSITVREGEDLYFKVKGYDPDTQRLRIGMTGTDRESLESLQDDEDYKGYLVYHLVPVADTTITFTTEERKSCEVVIEKSDNVKSFEAYYDGDDGEIDTAGTYTIREDGYITISDIIATGSETEAAAKKGKVIYRIGEEPYEVLPEYDIDPDMGYAEGPFYRIKVTDDMKISIDVQDMAQYMISFKDYTQLENIYVWELGTDKEKDNLYKVDNGSATLDDNGYYYFDFQLKDGVGLDSVTLTDGVGNGRILERVYLEEESEMGYRLGTLRGDVEIIPKLVSGYTVKFDLSKLSNEDAAAVKIYDSDDSTRNDLVIGQKEGKDIGSRKLSFATTEKGLFYLVNPRKYKLTPDSGLFTLTKVWGEDNYVYVIQPKQTENLPKVVTISLERYEEYNVTLNCSDEIRSISLKSIDGNEFVSVEDQANVYKVYGEGAVLRVKAIDGYSPVVKVKGTVEGATETELTPFRLDSEGAAEYYLDELEEDKVIQVTVTRSTQKKTYKVGFISEGGHVTVRDGSHDTMYDVATVQGRYSADYSVMRGDKISFYVEPDLGYELKGVYANGQEVQPVRNGGSQRDIYEVTPVADTQIRIDVSWIVPKYPLTFSWTNTDAIKSVKVQGYELQDNRTDVAAGTKISFTVELTDTKYSVTSVKMNGQEIPYSAGSGYYTLTALYEPMNVEINADVADKVVRFSNTLENAQYEVETNELIRLRNGDTYLASGNADLLKFKVNVSDKTQKVGVTYINQKGVKSVLKEKGQTDLGEQGLSYSYEIAVADLPLNSEITISGAVLAGDKTALGNAVTQYEGYKKSDYTEASWTAFATALKEAQDCMKKEDATQEEIDAVLGRLQKAAAALVKKEEDPNPPTPEHHEGLWFEILENEETADGSYVYTGAAIKPDIKVYNGDKPLEVKKDYTVAYKNNTNAGTATITVTGKGNFKSNATATFTINRKDISDGDISAADVYAIMKANGTVANPKVAVKFGKKTLKANSDYKVVWPEASEIKDTDGKVKAGVYNVTISTTAVKKVNGKDVDSVNYSGERTIAYTVLANDAKLMSKATITLTARNVDYADRNDPAKRPQVKTVKISGKEVSLEEFIIADTGYEQAGKATITVTGKDQAKYYGSKSVTYDVKGTKLASSGFVIEKIDNQDYTGTPIYINKEAADAGMRKLVVKPKSGGTALTEGTDYTVSYATGKKAGEHTNAGTVTVTITGMGAYTGSMKTTFKIMPVDLSTIGSNSAIVFAAPEAAKYTKAGAKPEITEFTFNGTPLAEKQDYTVSYTKNTKVDAGKKSATMTIKGKGNFKGLYKHTYEVTLASKDDVYATATDIVKPTRISQVKSTIKVFETETGKALKAGTDYEKTIKYYSDAACTKEITAENFDKPIADNSDKPIADNSYKTPTDIDAVIYAKIDMKGSYAGAADTSGPETAVFRVYDKDLKMTSSQLEVTINTAKDRNGKDIICDNKHNPYYTGADIEPKVTVTIKGSKPAVTLTEGVDYRVEYTNNVNKGKATVTVTGIDNGYGGAKSMKFTIVPKDMKWAEQAVKKAAEALSGLVPVTE